VTFLALAAAVSVLAGGITAVTGFGIGGLLTPLLNTRDDMRVAVATVSIPHLVATALRLWMLRHDIDRRVLKSFGLTSAAGGLTGALVQLVRAQYVSLSRLSSGFSGSGGRRDALSSSINALSTNFAVLMTARS
jgi:uncharacterized membrane protein YfcA